MQEPQKVERAARGFHAFPYYTNRLLIRKTLWIMNVENITSGGKQQAERQSPPPRTEATLRALPKVRQSSNDKDSQTGVSTRNALSGTNQTKGWYVLRTTYGRERKAHAYITQNKGISFCPTTHIVKEINGKRKEIEVSLIPNLLFAYGTEKEIQQYVYDNTHLPYLRYYYRQVLNGTKVIRQPLTVPDADMESFRLICEQEKQDIVVQATEVTKFKTGQRVRVIFGPFAGVEGRVARFKGQQRVGIVINGLLTVTTAYVPNGFLEVI
jgi:transcription antitermination factor NusG